MKRYLLLYAVCTTALLVYGYRRHCTETKRLIQNQTALGSDIARYRNLLGEATASAQVLRLHCSEYEKLRVADAERIRKLGIRLGRLEAAAKTVAATEVVFQAPLSTPIQPVRHGKDSGLRDRPSAGPHLQRISPMSTTPFSGSDMLRPYVPAACSASVYNPRTFRWCDTWVTVEGIATKDSVRCRVESVDTLRQIVHRVPRRFLFFRWGTKAIRQEISSSNPHTKIVWTAYIRFER